MAYNQHITWPTRHWTISWQTNSRSVKLWTGQLMDLSTCRNLWCKICSV